MSVAGLVSRFIRTITSNDVLWQHEVEDFERLFPEIYRDANLPEDLDNQSRYYRLYPRVYDLQARSYNYLLEHKILDANEKPLDVYNEISKSGSCFENATVVRRRSMLSRWNSLIALRQISSNRDMISIKGLTEVPSKIIGLLARFSSLRRLEFQYCAFEHLPDEIGRLVHLETLLIKNTCLKFLPDAIGSLTGLTNLDISDNNLLSLPKNLVFLRQLRYFNLQGNVLKELPADPKLQSFLESLGYNSENLLSSQLIKDEQQDPSSWPSYWAMRLNGEEQKIILG